MQELLKIISEFFEEDVKEDSKFGDFEKWDSLGHLNLFMLLEEKYNKKFDIEEILNAKNVKDIYRILHV